MFLLIKIVGLQTWKPLEFANQINLSEHNMWGVLKYYIDMCMALEPGTYLFVKDPAKRLVRLYSVPDDAFAEKDVLDADEAGGDYNADDEELDVEEDD